MRPLWTASRSDIRVETKIRAAGDDRPDADIVLPPTAAAFPCGGAGHWTRRGWLGGVAGGFGAGAMLGPIADLLGNEPAVNGVRPGDPSRPRSVILLWLQGGASQLETFDPHPEAKHGGSVKAIETSVPGLRIADTLPRLAERMRDLALVRSVIGNEGDHERAIYQIQSGYRPDPTLIHPSVGAILCHQSDLGAEIPRHISILPLGRPGRGGYLGAKYDAFKVGDPSQPIPDVQHRMDEERFRRRIDDLLNVVEPRFARGRLIELERTRTLHAASTNAALTMMTSEQLSAFDVSDEPAAVREGFGDTAQGRGCLAAVRLVEAGVRCVEVTFGGWDSHINNHSLQTSACQLLDPSAAALIDELKKRDLWETTLVVVAGEFGRTPRINPAEGRDHWVHGFSIALGGCGIRSGVVHGETAAERDADDPAAGVSDPVGIADVHATLLTALGIDPKIQLETPIRRPMRLSEGEPIGALLADG